MAVAQTSIWAYEGIRRHLGPRHHQVYEAIQKLEPVHNGQIAKYLGLPINQVTGRVNELAKMGLVEVYGLENNESGRKVKHWVHKDLGDQYIKKVSRFDRDGVRI
jgi:DNA-binding MarR family transcriptional regulator